MPSIKPKLSRIQKRLSVHPELRVPLGKLHTQDSMDNKFWDVLQEQYAMSRKQVAEGYTDFASNLESVRLVPQAMAAIEDGPTLGKNIRLLTKDSQLHLARLDGIYEKHATKVGGTKTPEEHMEAFSLQHEYLNAQAVYDGVVTPTLHHITEQMSAADPILISINEEIERMRAEQAAARAAVPLASKAADVTDVVAK